MKKRIYDIIFLTMIIFIILPGILKPILKPYEVNYYENRPSIKFIKPNINNILSNEFQDNIEKTFADQIPFATYMKKANNLLESFLSVNLNNNLYKNYKDSYIPFNSLYLYNNKIVYDYLNALDVKNILDMKINNFNSYKEKYKEINFYLYYIESDNDINFETNEKSGIYEYIRENLNFKEENISKFTINNFEEYNEYYYDTDHHWNYKGGYKGYTEISELMNFNNVIKPNGEDCVKQIFNGSKSYTTKVADIKYDKLCAYIYEFDDVNIYINNELGTYGNEETYLNGQLDNITYSAYYGDDYSVVKFDYENKEKDNVLVIGNSFDNSIAKLLATNFNKSYFVDLREYKDFDFSTFVEENEIDTVLINGPYSLFEDENIILKG